VYELAACGDHGKILNAAAVVFSMNRSGGAGDGAADLHFLASPKMLAYSPKARLLVTTTEVRS
jgi:hypothetical protein